MLVKVHYFDGFFFYRKGDSCLKMGVMVSLRPTSCVSIIICTAITTVLIKTTRLTFPFIIILY